MESTQMLILALAVLVGCSAFFSATETAFSSANKIRLKNLANDGNRRAELALEKIEDYDSLISTILIGNNIVNIASSTIATVIFTGYFGNAGPSISTVVMTIVILIFGEITPKSIAKSMPESLAMGVVRIISFLIALFTPLNFFFNLWKKLVAKVLKIEQGDDSYSQDELLTIVEEAENDGNLESHESDLITAAIEFNDLDVKDILTPRVDLVAVDSADSLDEIEKVFRMNSFSRLPVYDDSIDNIIGMIHEKDFYNLYYHSESKNHQDGLKSIIKETIFTSMHVKISSLLRQLQSSKVHMAIVIDEYGGTAGIITMEDILEELVGDIWDEHDKVKEYYQQVSENVYLVRCDVDLDDFFERFDLEECEDYDFVTVSGWVSNECNCIPEVGVSFDYENLHVVVTKADARRVTEIQVEVRENTENENEDKEK